MGVKVEVHQLLFAEPLVNILHVQAANPNDGFVLAQIATTVRDQWISQMLPQLSQDISLVNVTATDISVEGGQQSVQVPSGDAAGDYNGASLPSNQAFVITHRTARVGRSYRGRTYVAGLPEALVTGNHLALANAQGIAAAFNTIRTTLAENDFIFSVLSRFNQGDERPLGVLTAVTTSVARETRVDSQRRRLP